MFNFQAKKKKKKPTQNQKSNLPVPTVTSLPRIQRKPIPNILRQSIHITIYRAKAKQTKSNILCLLKKKKKPNIEPLYQNGKSKPKPQYSLLGRRNLPIVVVAVARPSSQITVAIAVAVAVSPLIADRSAQIRTSGAQLAASPLVVAVVVSGAQLKVFLISLSFSLSVSLSLSH